jgi:hypothetical protein
LQRTGISAPLIDNLPHNVVVARPLKRNVGCFFNLESKVKSNTTFTVLLGFAITSLVALAQTSRAPAIPSPEEVLKRPMGQWAIEKSDTLAMLVIHSFRQAKVPGGIAYPPDFDEKARIKIRPKGSAFQDVLDSMVNVGPGYKWEFVGGVVNVMPAESYLPLLDTFVPEFPSGENDCG